MMFEIEREKCYEGIKMCDAFLKNYSVMFHGKNSSMDKVSPKYALHYCKNRHKKIDVIIRLKLKEAFIWRLAEMQETENIAEHAKNDRG